MGGRGATSRNYFLNGKMHTYGDEYRSVAHPIGMMKFVVRRDGKPTKAPTDSMTPGRIYATINEKTGQLHSLSFIGADGKQFKQIDLQDHRGLGAHAHDGYNHAGVARELNSRERHILELTIHRVKEIGGNA